MRVYLWLYLAHSPDNSFMGFVVERHVKTSTLNDSGSNVVRKNQAVVYGKAEYMWSVSSNW